MSLISVADYYFDYFTMGAGSAGSYNESTAKSEFLLEWSFIVPGTTFVVEDDVMWMRLRTDRKYRHQGFSAEVQRMETAGMSVCFYKVELLPFF